MKKYRFKKGDFVLLVSKNGKKWLVKIEGRIDTHIGSIDLSEIVGKENGAKISTSTGHSVYCFTPTLSDFIILMKRKAQVIYPKDLAPILFYGDVSPGQRILEAGTGSGALTISLLRAIGKDGELFSIEKRKDFLKIAKKNIEKYFGKIPNNLKLILGDVNLVIKEKQFDRIFLDLEEPWVAIDKISKNLVNGGLIVTYSPNVGQVQETVKELRKNNFFDIRVFEFLEREWLMGGIRARPKDRMVGHTGFITVSRRVLKDEM